MISSLSCYAQINEFGFIESPYRKVEKGRAVDYVTILNGGDTGLKVGEHVEKRRLEESNREAKARHKRGAENEPYCFYLSAWEEDKYVIAQANVELDEHGRIVPELVNARQAAISY